MEKKLDRPSGALSALEAKAKTELFCRGCGDPKDEGMVVCWGCWKYIVDIPFKYFSGTLEQWLKERKLPRGGFTKITKK